MKTRFITIISTTIVVVLVVAKLFYNKKVVEDKIYREDPGKEVLVRVVEIAPKAIERRLSYTGTFEPYRTVSIIPQVQGTVREVFFEEGDQIKIGQPLVQIDDDLLRAQRIGIEASYENAQTNLARYHNAAATGGISKTQIDNASLQLRTAESQLKQIEKNISLHRVVAPFTGTITDRNVEPGSLVGASPIAQLADLSRLKLSIVVPETEILFFNPRQEVSVQSSVYRGETFSGIVERIAEVSNESHQYEVEIIFQNKTAGKLKAGMYGTAFMMPHSKTSALVIPRAALLGSAKKPQVFVLDNGVATLRDIETGYSTADEIEVTAGLSKGDRVVYSGQINLTQGTKAIAIK
jgi:RND family efflux transporter MFP subunit